MNERYLFRGKSVDTGKWVQGYLGWSDVIIVNCGMDPDTGFIECEDITVDPDSVEMVAEKVENQNCFGGYCPHCSLNSASV